MSVCAEYSFKKYIDGVILRNETNLGKAKKLIKSNIWNRNETFYFVNHKSPQLGDFPCMTTSESPDRGRPCNFPFIYATYVQHDENNDKINSLFFRTQASTEEGFKVNQSIYLENCTFIVSSESWCWTKVQVNLQQYGDKENWGFCRDKVNHIFKA